MIQGAVRGGPIGVGKSQTGVKFDRRVVVFDGPLMLAQGLVNNTPVVVRQRQSWVQIDGSAKVIQSGLAPAQFGACPSAIPVRFGIDRVEPDRVVQRINGLFVFAVVEIGHSLEIG